jgi:hypothetical protein
MLSVNIAWNSLGKAAARAWSDLFTPQSRCMVEEWDLRDNFLGDEAALGHFLANTVKSQQHSSSLHHSSVRWLNIANNRLDDQGIGHLAEAMPIFAGLEVFLLYNNPDLCTTRSGFNRTPQKASVEYRGISTLMKALGQSLRVLKLGSCALGDEGTAAACRPLVGHPALTELDLSDNGIGEGVANPKLQSTMSDLLRNTRTLKVLCLSLNFIGDDLTMKFLQCLCVETPFLEHLDLSANGVSQDLKSKVLEKVKAEEDASEADLPNTKEQPLQTSLETAGLFTAIYPLGNRVYF